MRHESSITSLSWIPSEAVEGSTRLAFDAGITHYDDPPPDQIDDLEALRVADRFRFANVLRGWIEVGDGGEITGCGYAGGGLMGSTTVRVGGLRRRFQAPFVQWQAPLVWTTLSLTLHADGRAESTVTGASSFPRHWIYDHRGALSHKSGLTDFRDWYRSAFGRHSPWGDTDSPALITAVGTALERTLSVQLMHGSVKPRISKLKAGDELARQGAPGTDAYLVLDGVIRIDRNGEPLAEYGPGAMLGERAHLEGGLRTASMIAVTACRIAAVDAAELDHAALEELAGGHRREDAIGGA
jgi:hypothetical protein